MITTNWGAATDVGLVRHENQDAFIAQMPLFVVADGMGGHAAGALASTLAVGEFSSLQAAGVPTVEAVARSIDDANCRIRAEAAISSGADGMGTTVVGLALVSDHDQELWLVFNVGDSRLYRLWEDNLTQITTDHSEVQELVEAGAITSEAARRHPDRNVITRAVGISDELVADFWLRQPEPGERFLLSTDGLTGEVADEDIRRVLMAEADPSVAATRLVERALAMGGHDNVTAVVVDVIAAQELLGQEEGDTARSRPARGRDIPPRQLEETEPVPLTLIDSVPIAVRGSVGHAGDIRADSGTPTPPPQAMIDEVPGDGAPPRGGQTVESDRERKR
ncbi:MAG: protein phosphatase 2C domain-containing protein [Actinomycetota bacterium]|nr:protein phosphatase 2C domain-containing protein [Actinomycetota bacterium]